MHVDDFVQCPGRGEGGYMFPWLETGWEVLDVAAAPIVSVVLSFFFQSLLVSALRRTSLLLYG